MTDPHRLYHHFLKRSRTLRLAKWFTLIVSLFLMLTWVATFWRGLYSRNGVFTLMSCNSGFTVWKASATNSKYAKVNETYLFAVPAFDLHANIPSITTSPGLFDWIVRIPYWLPLILLTPATIAIWRRDRRINQLGLCPNCNYNRSTLPSTSRCPECGTT